MTVSIKGGRAAVRLLDDAMVTEGEVIVVGDVGADEVLVGRLVEPGGRVRVTSRRGSVEGPVWIDPGLRPGLAFMTLHFQDDVATNLLTIDATDPKSGTAEFKATAIRIEKLGAAVPA